FQRALVATMLALVFLILFAVVLAIFLVAVLNKYLGDPWGTGVAGLILLVCALVFAMRARSNFKEMEREASQLSMRGR
ncbi:MAG TPA: hypothetical protein VM370_07225, partial [Candidatus Thermoplasmatota archaeon]|nr:hypothetical protein [Candidatus Thermoplasmatota archaeon]